MARKLRVEVPGGLYHIVTRGNDRRYIFHSSDDHQKLLDLLAVRSDPQMQYVKDLLEREYKKKVAESNV